MKIIQELCDKIDEEIADSTTYAKMAIENKTMRPQLAEVLYSLSVEEYKHMNLLHGEVVKLIEEYRKTKGEPPEGMMAVYNYQHAKSMEKAAEARSFQSLYKGN